MVDNKSLSNNCWTFFLFTYIYSWIFWITGIIINQTFNDFPTILFLYLGGIGPSLVGIVLTYKFKTKKERKNFWKSSFDVRSIRIVWYGVILGASIIPIIFAGLIDLVIGGKEMRINYDCYDSFFTLFPYLIFLIIAVLAEEFGWRGYAQDALQNKYSALISSLVLGSFWALWHLPLFFMKNSYQYNLGVATLEFWLFFITIIPNTIIFTWIFNNTNHSILSAILFHFCINFFGETILIDTRVDVFKFFITLILSIIIVVVYGHSKLIKEFAKERESIKIQV
jgi:membrane protease YdiL (CAAX protease family)